MGTGREVLKKSINGLFNLFGRELRSVDTPLHTFARGLKELKRQATIASIIDVGVADGTPELYTTFKGLPTLLVEANPEYNGRLDELAHTIPARAEKVFCGAAEGTVPLRIYHSGRKASRYKALSTESEHSYIHTREVPVKTLDSLVGSLPKPHLLKIDVEGAELEVLKGAQHTLKDCAAVILEVSVVPRYENAPQLSDVVCYMKDRSFSVYDMMEGTIEEGKLLMVDFIFVPTGAVYRRI